VQDLESKKKKKRCPEQQPAGDGHGPWAGLPKTGDSELNGGRGGSRHGLFISHPKGASVSWLCWAVRGRSGDKDGLIIGQLAGEGKSGVSDVL
jgi:hypothetical protein